MGSFIHYCKHCNAKLNVDDAWLGKSMKCPACSKKITFPNADGSIEQSNPAIDLKSASSTADADFPTAPDFAAAAIDSNMPSAPDFQMPDPPSAPSAPAPATGSSPRRIKLKPLSGNMPAVSAQNSSNTDTAASGEIPPPPTAPKSIVAPPAPPAVAEPQFESLGSFSSIPDLTGENSNDSSVQEKTVPETVSAETQSNAAVVEPAFIPLKKGFFKGSYFWGRLGSASVYVLAVITLLSGIYYSLHLYWDYRAAEDMIPEKQDLANVNKELTRREKSLSGQFKNAVNLLQGSGVISADGVLDGLQLSDDICRRPDPMPLGLLTSRELKVAQNILAQYKNSNAKIKEEFVRCFGRILTLESQNKGAGAANGISQIILQAGEVKKQFYANENTKLAQLNTLENAVRQVKNSVANNGTDAQKEEVKRFEAASSFVRKQLFPAESNITIVKAANAANTAGSNAKSNLSMAANLILSLANGWRLDEETAGMEMLLEKVPVLTEVYEKKKNDYLRKMGKEMVTLWLKTLLTAFALLVLGDVLRAYFDKADILRRIEGKK